MPELPEVETVRRGLEAYARGHRIEAVEIRDPRVSRRHLDPAELAGAIVGTRITAFRRIGKWLLLDLDSAEVLVSHLRMAGQWLRGPDPSWRSGRLGGTPGGDDVHVRAVLHLSGGRVLRYKDTRRFGELFVLDGDAAAALVGRQGADPLTLTGEELGERLAGRRGALKAALVNQSILAGVGNIYSDEALWQAGLRWDRPAGSLRRRELDALAAAIRDVLARGLEAGGTSARDNRYRNPDGEIGSFQLQLEVYQREGAPCRRCGTPIQRRKRSSSSTYYCPNCQRIRRDMRPDSPSTTT